MASEMATNRPQYHVDNQGYSVNTTQEADESQESGTRADTKINMPTSQPPQYSAAIADKYGADKKVKVRELFYISKLLLYLSFLFFFH